MIKTLFDDEDEQYYSCPNCGATLSVGMNYCYSCGEELEWDIDDSLLNCA